MKKVLVSIFVLTLVLELANASHNKGGEITFKKISGFKYEVTITTYTSSISPADRSSLEIEWGDGYTEVIDRTMRTSYNNLTSVNTYTKIHEYPGYGIYKICMSDPMRNEGIENIPNSVNTLFYIESLLVLNPKISNNFSVEFGVVPTMVAACGKEYRFNVSAYLLDDFPIHYELVPCKGHRGEDIPGYTFPENMELNSQTGEIVWQVPENSGSYNIAVKISRLVNGNSLGYCIRDFQINTFTNYQSDYLFTGYENWPRDENGTYNYSINPDDTLELELTYQDDNADEIFLSSFSEIYLIDDSAEFETIEFFESEETIKLIKGTFKWTPNESHIREYPYIATFTGKSKFNSDNLFDHNVTLAIYVEKSMLTSDKSFKANEINDGIIIYPNPAHEFITVKLEYDLSIYNDLNFSIYDMNGRKVYSRYDIRSNIFTINPGVLKSGNYIYILEGDSELTAMGKMVIH